MPSYKSKAKGKRSDNTDGANAFFAGGLMNDEEEEVMDDDKTPRNMEEAFSRFPSQLRRIAELQATDQPDEEPQASRAQDTNLKCLREPPGCIDHTSLAFGCLSHAKSVD